MIYSSQYRKEAQKLLQKVRKALASRQGSKVDRKTMNTHQYLRRHKQGMFRKP